MNDVKSKIVIRHSLFDILYMMNSRNAGLSFEIDDSGGSGEEVRTPFSGRLIEASLSVEKMEHRFTI